MTAFMMGPHFSAPRRAWQRLTRAAWRIFTARVTPTGVGWAVFVGIIIGTTPFIGLQLPIALVVCALLRLNPAIAYLAANISLPPVIPLLAYGSIQTGYGLMYHRFLSYDEAMLLVQDSWSWDKAWTFGRTWVLGSLVFGAALGAPLGLTAGIGMFFYRRRHPLPIDYVGDAMARVVGHFKVVSRFSRGYVQGKFRHDPVYRQLAGMGPFAGPVVDAGCGRGHTGFLLSELQANLDGLGFDWDADKVRTAKKVATAYPSWHFVVADMALDEFPSARTLLMLDVLHYHSLASQESILARAAEALLPGGRLFLREVDGARGLRTRITRWQEQLGRSFGINLGRTLAFRPIAEIRARLEQAGLRVTTIDSFDGTPLANVLLIAEKPAADVPPTTSPTLP